MLITRLSSDIQECFAAAGFPDASATVTHSQRPEFGQFQTNAAMAIAKAHRQPPRKIAEAVVAQLGKLAHLRDVSIQGPGFINFSLTDDYLQAQLRGQVADPRGGVPPADKPATVVLDYGGPNVAKAMHVGHLRSSIIGDTLRRLAQALGHRTIADVHLGDWGLPMGMVLSEMLMRAQRSPGETIAADIDKGVGADLTIDELNELYPAAAARCKSDEAALAEARRLTMELQNGHPGLQRLWSRIVEISIAAARQEFARLNVTFDLWYGESRVHERLTKLVPALEAKGFAQRDQGALIIPVARPDDDHEIPPFILEKSDGAVMYGGTDLATIAERVEEFDPDVMLYIVDQRQRIHFEQVFRAAETVGLIRDGRPGCEHIGFGTVNGPDGKPLKTRSGGVLKLSDLIDQATDVARTRLQQAELAAGTDIETTAQQLGIATIRFADLANNRVSDYIFNLEKFSAAEGRTGPYLCYSAVRASAILERADKSDLGGDQPLVLDSAVERDLVIGLLGLGDAATSAFDKRLPNILCEHLFGVAQAFNAFYHQIHVLTEPDTARRRSLLALVAAVEKQLRLGLSLLGIEAPQKM